MRTRITGAFTLILLLMFGLMASAQGDPSRPLPGEQISGIVEFDGVRVYSGPDFAYAVIGELAQNTQVTVTGRRGDFFYQWDGRQWLAIDFGMEMGWVYARMIRTSIPFNSIFPTGRQLPRTGDGSVPDSFSTFDNVCETWTGTFTLSGSFLAGDSELTVTYPELPGTTIYSVITISPNGTRRAHDSFTTTATIRLDDLPNEGGTYTWRVAPFYALTEVRSQWQQICLLQTGGTFEVAGPTGTLVPTRSFRSYYYVGPTLTPGPTPTLIPFVP